MSTKKEMIAREVAKAVGAGKPVAMETVDFNDPNRPKTCLEVDFPILPINAIAAIEAASGAAKKPIYQMSKWWARRQSSVFRSMLIAAATKAPDDPSMAAKLVWDNYYANHQKKGAFKHLKVADIFMGGGTTLVEGSRLGMQMIGNDLNPVAWFVVKQEFAKVDIEEVKRLLADVEAEVRKQVMPFYCCDGPNGEKGKWTHIPSGRVEGPNFDPLTLTPNQRKDYKYDGPESIYTFWVKHGPCDVTACGHLTPIISNNVISSKQLTVKYWPATCSTCHAEFDIEQKLPRLAPDAPFYSVDQSIKPHCVVDTTRMTCPSCGDPHAGVSGKAQSKKVLLSVLALPDWLEGLGARDTAGKPYGGSTTDHADATARWFSARGSQPKLLEVRGELPDAINSPITGKEINVGRRGGTVSKKSHFVCSACGKEHDVLASMTSFGKSGPTAALCIQGYSSVLEASGNPYGGRFFADAGPLFARQVSIAWAEWEQRRQADLAAYWPTEALPFGFKTSYQRIPEHGYPHFHDMFNARQLLLLSQLLQSIITVGGDRYEWQTREAVLGAFQQYLRNQCMFCFWHARHDMLTPHLSNNNYHPKNISIENNFVAPYGYGNWRSCTDGILEGLEWARAPWELVSVEQLRSMHGMDVSGVSGQSEKVWPADQLQNAEIEQCSSTELVGLETSSLDLIITDPPFGNNIQYSELADFFYVWLRLALKNVYPSLFAAHHTPKAVEVVTNPVRDSDDPEGHYRRLLTGAWKEAFRILRPGGLLAFTFHHSEDEPWEAVLQSLFDAGFYLEAAYPIRSDETKGEGSKPGTFGSQQIEFDIVHVCRKRLEEPSPVSWARMRREVIDDVKRMQSMLEGHAKQGLPEADLQVIKRGKALEYFSRHYGKVFKSDGEPISVKEALVGINQILDEDTGGTKSPPPVNAEPMTRQFLRIFDKQTAVPRDQMQKFMRGTGAAPDDFEHRGWCKEKSKVFNLVEPLAFAQDWQGRHRRKLSADLDQALVLIGACFDNSGINAADTLKNDNFKPHPALKDLLEWFMRRGADQATRNAAGRAVTIYNSWAAANQAQVKKQLDFFRGEEEAA
ncbi:MAG: DUF1156 domain-containing protein [Hyphomicrobium sp.]